ncbi:MAG TPA: transaldolase family protein [Candidatus Limnocylindrales bacterium]|nr:transaldolase family protein [Candidatus Limnocylindrales bacterium]
MAPGLVDCPLLRTVAERPTDYWNDSCALAELEYAVARGATGATSNPSIVLEVLRKEWDHWAPRVVALAEANPAWTETELTWAVIEEMAVRGAGVLEPVFVASGGRTGRLSIQTNPANYRNGERMLEQALHFTGLAPNVQVKFPATRAGIPALEEATARGVSINATVCFTVPQAIAVAEAVERGLDALAARGGDPATVAPVCTIMIGRLDDWMRVLVERDDIAVQPDALNWAGIAAFKRAYAIFRERGYRARLLAAAYRHRLHWTELAGGDVILTMPHAWQVRFNGSGIAPTDRIDEPVDPALVAELRQRIPDFGRAYEPDGLTIDEFDTYGATARTLRGFIASYHDLVGVIRDLALPNPDVRPN